ncbi:zinc-dependent alcohol dehydrogenase family protein [Aspergillus lucknowensis]|uniref:Chaperonin 10-like protein n=1 Tax=Aspergillus lucknowensis TaxID=176173 RepID=A0ABR4M194_9EURO
MKALVYTDRNECAIQDRPIPTIQSPTDAIVKMQHTTISGTDLHILSGDLPVVEPGRVLGHEGIGTIASLGSAVSERDLYMGDQVLISCITSCGVCAACRRSLTSHCHSGGGWALGCVIDGTQAEYVRIPHAASSLHRLPTNIDARACVAFSAALPTGYECGTLHANVQPGDRVAIVGAGAVGLSALLTARLYTPSLIVVIDLDETRLAHAKRLGADEVINPVRSDAMERLDELSGEHGFDSAIEAVGRPQTFELCQRLVGPGGSIANIGVHGQRAEIVLDRMWDHNINIKTGLVDTVTIPTLLKLYQSRKIDPSKLFTHQYRFSDIVEAYHSFQHPAKDGMLKVEIQF